MKIWLSSLFCILVAPMCYSQRQAVSGEFSAFNNIEILGPFESKTKFDIKTSGRMVSGKMKSDSSSDFITESKSASWLDFNTKTKSILSFDFNRKIKQLVSGYPFDVSRFSDALNIRSLQHMNYKDTVLKGGVWRGAVIGALIGMAAAGLAIAALNEDDLLSPTHDQRMLMVGWGAVNGAGIGGFIGFGRQRKKQRQLNKF